MFLKLVLFPNVKITNQESITNTKFDVEDIRLTKEGNLISIIVIIGAA